jgi:serine-type D-Ala-D-Ala endopeptidase (penicillin-binding protein 7)
MKTIIAVLLLVVAAVLGYTAWYSPDFLPWSRWWDRDTQVVRAVPPPAPVASGPVTEPPEQPVEQVGESADSATPLQEMLPRRSEGRRLGLDDTKDSLRLHSSAALVMDAGTRNVIYAKNPDVVLPMASITKLMTALVLVESKVPMDEVITITEDDMDKERHSRSRLRVGSVLTRGEALHLALMSSENRAAHALGRTFPGGLEKFVAAMNQRARQLGMDHTTYVDPTGLSSDNKSTPRDLATLALAAAQYPLVREYSTDRQHLVAFGKRTLQYKNSNALVRGDLWDIELQKTGYIVEAGHCVVMDAKLHGKELVIVLLDSESNGRRNADAQKIRSWWNAQNGIVEAPPQKIAKVKAEPENKDRKDATDKKVAKDRKAPDKKVAARSGKAEKAEKKKTAKSTDREHARDKRVHAQFAAK